MCVYLCIHPVSTRRKRNISSKSSYAYNMYYKRMLTFGVTRIQIPSWFSQNDKSFVFYFSTEEPFQGLLMKEQFLQQRESKVPAPERQKIIYGLWITPMASPTPFLLIIPKVSKHSEFSLGKGMHPVSYTISTCTYGMRRN